MKAVKQVLGSAVQVVLVFAFVGGTVRPVAAQVAKVKAANAAAKSPTAARPSGGQHEGIKVHGDWTLVIRNKDGSLAARHQFRNALADAALLPLLLNHGGSVGRWQVRLNGAGVQPCIGSTPLGTIQIPCVLVETGGAPAFGVLQLAATSTAFELRGTVQVNTTTQIANVATLFEVCPPTNLPSASCFSPNGTSLFTSKDVTGLNINVSASQTVDVFVKISFS